MSVATLENVTRTFDAVTALDDVTLTLGEGELIGMLGPNGAGKSTLLSLVSGLRKPSAGTVRLFGRDPRHASARATLGTTPQETGLPPTLRVAEVVDFVAGHYPDPLPTAHLLEMFDLTSLARRQTGGLSGGQKRRLAVALAIVGRPRLVLLDEPTTGLDVDARRVLWDAVRAYHASGSTVVVTSHYLEEIEALAQRVVVIDEGHVLADDSLAAIVARVGARHVRVTLPERTTAQLTAPEWAGAAWAGSSAQVVTADSDALVRDLVHAGVEFHDLQVRGATLEEAFLAMTRSGAEGRATDTNPAGPPAPTRQEQR